jgi:hypothetical protein
MSPIFNTLGQEIQTLVSQNLDAGTYRVQWQAANVPSGVYYLQLRAGSFVETKKLIVLK